MTTTWQLGDLAPSARGARTAPLHDNGQQVVYMSARPLSTPYQPSALNDNSRPSLELVADQAMGAFFHALDEWTLQYCAQHAQRVLGRDYTLDELRAAYRPSITHRFPDDLVRCKLATRGAHRTRYWDCRSQERDAPQDFTDALLRPRLVVSHLWTDGQRFGWVILASDVLVEDGRPQRACPWAP